MVLAVGEKAVTFIFTDQNGKEWNFPHDFEGERVALYFLRHLGCPLCKEKIAELKDSYSRFEEKKVKIIVVVQSTQKRIEQFGKKEGLPFPLVADRGRKLYKAFEVPKGGLKEFLPPSVLKASLRATLKGHMHGRFEGNEFQVPAAFMVSPNGVIIYNHEGKDISDFGDTDEILAKECKCGC